MKIAVSGLSGCGNTSFSKKLSQRLSIGLINYTFRNLAEQQGVSFEKMQQMAQEDSYWDRYLDQYQQQLICEQDNGILASRLAIWFLPQADLRIYLEAPISVRAQRIAQREKLSFDVALAQTQKRDEQDHQRYWEYYQIDNYQIPSGVLCLDSHHYNPEQLVQQILEHPLMKKKL